LKYLYGDASEFPKQYNFLDTLRAFVECSGKAAVLEHEISLSEETLAEQSRADSQQMELVSDFCEGVIEDVRARAAKIPGAETVEAYATQVVDAVMGHLDAAQGAFMIDSKERRTRAEAEIEDKREEIRALVDAFLTTSDLGVESSAFSMRLTDQTVSLGMSAEHPGGISTSFELDPQKSRHWSQPQKVQALLPGLTLQVGFVKKFLSKSLKPEMMSLDDHTITFVDSSPDACEVHISRRVDPPDDDLVITMTRTDEEVLAEIGAHGGEQHAAEPADMQSLEALWDALAERISEAMPHRRRLEWVKLDGADVIENGLMMKFVQRLVELFAPVSSEIARRSPNKGELSLKVELGDGRREEIYVKKADLVGPLEDLPDELKASFAALDIFPTLLIVDG